MEAKIILYGTDTEDTSPSEVAALLQMMGYSSIYIMTEGWSGWETKREN
jgi:3-mercaptopyruvate sulfurtransferase SseA